MNGIHITSKIAIFMQARVASSRLPGKIFFNLCEKSILMHIIERIEKIKKIYDYLVVLVPENELKEFQSHLKNYPEVIIFPGDPKNVLKRFHDANKKIKADVIVRLCGDNPLVDIEHLKKGILLHMKNNADYTYYDKLALGTGVEILNKEALNLCIKKSTEAYHFEHVTPYIKENPDLFHIQVLNAKGVYNHPEIRLTVDEEDDFRLIEIIYKKLYKGKPVTIKNVMKFLFQNPKYLEINNHVKQKGAKE